MTCLRNSWKPFFTSLEKLLRNVSHRHPRTHMWWILIVLIKNVFDRISWNKAMRLECEWKIATHFSSTAALTVFPKSTVITIKSYKMLSAIKSKFYVHPRCSGETKKHFRSMKGYHSQFNWWQQFFFAIICVHDFWVEVLLSQGGSIE